MKERPILFNSEMVNAIISGRKIQTRRPIKTKWKETEEGFLSKNATVYKFFDVSGHNFFTWDNDGSGGWNSKMPTIEQSKEKAIQWAIEQNFIKCPLGEIGDRLYVRETWQRLHDEFGYTNIYLADDPEVDGVKWKPSIHMPKKYARIWLEITDIRVERVQDIKGYEALNEGMKVPEKYGCPDLDPNWPDMFGDPRGAVNCVTYPNCSCGEKLASIQFNKIWDSIYKNWNDNPFVWVCEFKVMKK